MTATLEGVSGQQHPPGALYPGKGTVPILQEAGWAPRPVCIGGKARHHRDSIPDVPDRSQSSVEMDTMHSSVLDTMYSTVLDTMYSSVLDTMYSSVLDTI